MVASTDFTTVTISADGTAELTGLIWPKSPPISGQAEIHGYVYGTFGSGNVNIVGSPDGGTTKVTLSGLGTITTARDFVITTPATNYYAIVTGSTNPTIKIAYRPAS